MNKDLEKFSEEIWEERIPFRFQIEMPKWLQLMRVIRIVLYLKRKRRPQLVG